MAFAAAADIGVRLEETLSAGATAAATALCGTATAVVCVAAGESDETWFSALTTTQKAWIKGITIELVCRAMASPQGLSSASETLGAYTRSEDYRRDLSTALLLTPAEERLIGRIAGTAGSGSVRVHALPHDVYVTESSE